MTELKRCIPHRILAWLEGHDDVVAIKPEGSAFIFTWVDAQTGGLPIVMTTKVLDTVPLPASLDMAIRQAECVVFLPKNIVLCRVVDVPADARGDVNNAMPFLVERHTPFIERNARFTYRIVGFKTKQLMTIELAVTARVRLDAIESALAERGISISGIRVEGDLSQPQLEFRITNRSRQTRWHSRAAIGVAALLILFLGPLAVAGFVHNRLAQESAAAKTRKVDALGISLTREAFYRALAGVTFFRELDALPRPLEIIDSLTDALPDNAWLFRLDIDLSTVRLAGYSRDVPTVLRHLQSLPWARSVDYESSVLHDPSRQGDRFELRIQVRNNP